jgi:hypothetical protein
MNAGSLSRAPGSGLLIAEEALDVSGCTSLFIYSFSCNFVVL